jgi:P27 family predicted phage terminase small subunit
MLNAKNDIPRAPAGLGSSGKRFWKRIVEAYELEEHHLALLQQACKCLDDLDEAGKALQEQGRYFLDKYEQWKEHPAAGDARQLRGLFQRLVRELGLDLNDTESRPPRYGG